MGNTRVENLLLHDLLRRLAQELIEDVRNIKMCFVSIKTPLTETHWRDHSRRHWLHRDTGSSLAKVFIARPISEWHEDDGDVLWWRFPIDEPPYSGSPLDSDWPGYHTHWTPIVPPEIWENVDGTVLETFCKTRRSLYD